MDGDEHGADLATAIGQLLAANARAREELLAALDGIPAERRAEGWYGPEAWSLHDIVAHLFEWQNGFAHALERIARGERPEIPDYDPSASNDVFNALVVERNRGMEWDGLIAHLHAAALRHEAAVKNLAGKITPDRFEEGRTARRLADSAGHDQEHIPAILEWRRQQRI
jgi:uncharacterized damage-inducible protein DinB